jgi:hypothetical protein
MVVHICNTSYSGGGGRRLENLMAIPGKGSKTLALRTKYKQKGWGMGQVVECLL